MAETQSINRLMEEMRTETNIAIAGSRQKTELLNMGYFHGYKGYRFIRTKNDGIPFSSFDEIIAISQFDNNLKEGKLYEHFNLNAKNYGNLFRLKYTIKFQVVIPFQNFPYYWIIRLVYYSEHKCYPTYKNCGGNSENGST